MTQTYGSYLKIPELLSLQRPLSDGPEHDETLFIVIHQVYELWFKQILHESSYLQSALHAGDTPRVLHTFKRILTILKTLVVQIDVLETMTPLNFLSFRDRLASSSGFQSHQWRHVECMLGRRDRGILKAFPEGSAERRDLEQRMAGPSLWESFLTYLKAVGHPVPEAHINARPESPQTSTEVQDILIQVYRDHPIQAQVCERMVDLDEGVQEWRYRHVRMVERTIGTKRGTGGSSGAEYLRTTLLKSMFPDLWDIRVRL